MTETSVVKTPLNSLKNILNADTVREQFANSLGDNAPLFVASIIELFNGDQLLQQCPPSEVVMECLKASTLKLPINKSLGFAWILPYKKQGQQHPQFQMGVRGYIQLALRTGKYKHLNAGTLYEGQIVDHDYLTGVFKVTGNPTSDKAIGYFAHFELINGFTKSLFWDVDRVMKHGKKYSKSFNSKFSPWQTEPNEMGEKTMMMRLIKKFGIMSVEMSTAFTSGDGEKVPLSASGQLQEDVADHANQGEVIDIGTDEPPPENPYEPSEDENTPSQPSFMGQ